MVICNEKALVLILWIWEGMQEIGNQIKEMIELLCSEKGEMLQTIK